MEGIPASIEKALNEPVISDLAKIVGEHRLEVLLQLELTLLSERVGVGEYLTPQQLKFIASELISMFPNETLADFKICFQRGAMGQYGAIKFRLDGIVIREWIQAYLDEKYQIVEDKLMKEKDEYYKPVKPDTSDKDWYQVWLDSIKDSPTGKAVPQLTDEEIRKEGQISPPKREIYPSTDQAYHIDFQKRIREGREKTLRERYPEWSDEQINTKLKELES